MKFKFPLQSILHYRRSVEDKEWLRLQAIGQRLAAARKELTNAQSAYETLCRGNKEELKRGATAAELQFMRDCEVALDAKCAALLKAVEQIESEHKAQYAVFLRERQKRETLSTLREQCYTSHLIEAQRREQEQVDQMFLVKRSSSQP